MSDQQIIITVSGVDKVGIVSKVILPVGLPVLLTYTFKEIKEALTKTGEELGMEIWVQRKDIFDKMHTV